MITREELRDKLVDEIGCGAQHDGWPCNTCFHDMDKSRMEMRLEHHVHDYWEAVLDFRGDYDDYNWPIETDTSRFPELIEELYDKLQ